MDSESMASKVQKWLTQTGFPLEMRVASKLRQHPVFDEFGVSSNRHYVDSSTGSVREVDLQASFLVQSPDRASVKILVWVELVIECKSTSNPWVVLADPTDVDRSQVEVINFLDARRLWRYDPPVDKVRQFVAALHQSCQIEAPEPYSTGYSAVEAFKSANAKDAAYAATQQVLSASRHIILNDFSRWVDGEPFMISTVLPIVVTTSPLFEARLDVESNKIACREVDQAAVYLPDERGTSRLVLILSESKVDDLAFRLTGFNEQVTRFVDQYSFCSFGLRRAHCCYRSSL